LNDVKNIEIETYALFIGVNKSILKLNPFISEQGFEFIYLDASELEEKYSALFNFPKPHDPKPYIKFSTGVTVSHEFYKTFDSTSFVPRGADGLFMLKRRTKYILEIKNGSIRINNEAMQEVSDFALNLERKLRLFKNGDISTPVQFDLATESRHIYARSERLLKSNIVRDRYDIQDNEVEDLAEFLLKANIKSELTELAEMYFFDSYMIDTDRGKIVNLMTALESLFNRNPSQISHIIARHLSIIINLGSDIREKVLELQEITRSAILYCLNSDLNKDELFSDLNCKGFE